ncbi:peptidoglycan-binding domain-containing protein [Bombella mellum]|uniref:Peptidoglycan binding-like domain-containing protein n=1 Tax=Bombella mellum TaxID=2039288 RepID=A0ABR5ZV24_9PROT|nr:hypothetical protein [Bombella mellum]
MGYKPGMADPLAPTPTLRQGSHGSQVSQVQNELRDLGYRDKDSRPLAVTGKFDSSTKQAVEAFQTASGLKADGVIGPATRHRLDEAHQANQSTKAAAPDNAPSEAKSRTFVPEAKASRRPHRRTVSWTKIHTSGTLSAENRRSGRPPCRVRVPLRHRKRPEQPAYMPVCRSTHSQPETVCP